MCGCFILVTVLLVMGTVPVFSAGEAVPESLEEIPPDQLETTLARLSDEQIRSLLIAELRRNLATDQGKNARQGGFVARVARGLHILDQDEEGTFRQNLVRSWRHAHTLPDELDWLLRRFAQDASRQTAWRNIGLVCLILFGGFLAQLAFLGLTRRVRRQYREHLVPELEGMMRFWAALLHQLPSLVHMVVFTLTSLLLFFWSNLGAHQPLRYLFLALLFIILACWLARSISLIFCSPEQAQLRLLPIGDQGARRLHGNGWFLICFIVVSVTLLALFREVGLQGPSLSILAVGFASSLLLVIGLLSWLNRKEVAAYILSGQEGENGTGWLMEQLAGMWHVLVTGYLLIVWGFLIYNEYSGHGRQNGAFLISLFLVPLFLVLDRLAGWVVRSVIRAMRIYNLPPEEDEQYEEKLIEQKKKEQQLVLRVWRFARLAILAALAAWLFSLWGYPVPYAGAIVKATFDILLTLALALIFWRVASGYIERKIQEATPEEEENAEQDDEWGSASARGRSYTLLPMVRKFLGTVLVVMVTLIILSSLGVDIGPLLAGAGVVGLAIGFGAQKLVSDVFSGFFYLLDDAFRVGEYLQAGSVSGSVEAITLRNVMLRHHRGMLQIVPYSELGSITNFMRGGIVVKFNLEFPYDTDIDKVRKIIKKVGQAMLNDPEFGKDFIQPVKSQGVREITNSVMVIRVKFTAKPGTHFVIRREAYRRITEALAAKGIHYAHRKVIVELPESFKHLSEEQQERIREAGAAAAQAAMEDEEAKRQEAAGRRDDPGMPGM